MCYPRAKAFIRLVKRFLIEFELQNDIFQRCTKGKPIVALSPIVHHEIVELSHKASITKVWAVSTIKPNALIPYLMWS